MGQGASSATAASAKSSGTTPQVFQRIAYISPILEFSAAELMDAVRLSHVSRDFRESIMDYCPELWIQIARCVVEEPGFWANFLYSFQAPNLFWAVHNVYVKGGLDPNYKALGKTALFCAVKAKNIHVVELLLDCGALVSRSAAGSGIKCGGQNALQIAVTADHLDMVMLLASKSPGGDSKDFDASALRAFGTGVNILELAAEKGRVDMIKIIAAAFARSQSNAKQNNAPKIVSAEGAPSPKACDDADALTDALFFCCAADNRAPNAFKALAATCSKAQLLMARDTMGNSLAHVARGPLLPHVVSDLGVSSTSGNNEGNTPLMIAARVGAPMEVALMLPLLPRRDDVNIQNPMTGQTALHMAVSTSASASVNLLLLNGAAPSLGRYDYATPRDEFTMLAQFCVAQLGEAECCKMLGDNNKSDDAASASSVAGKERMLPIHSALISTSSAGSFGVAQTLKTLLNTFENASDGKANHIPGDEFKVREIVNAKTVPSGFSPAMLACAYDHAMALEMLLKKGAAFERKILYTIARRQTIKISNFGTLSGSAVSCEQVLDKWEREHFPSSSAAALAPAAASAPAPGPLGDTSLSAATEPTSPTEDQNASPPPPPPPPPPPAAAAAAAADNSSDVPKCSEGKPAQSDVDARWEESKRSLLRSVAAAPWTSPKSRASTLQFMHKVQQEDRQRENEERPKSF